MYFLVADYSGCVWISPLHCLWHWFSWPLWINHIIVFLKLLRLWPHQSSQSSADIPRGYTPMKNNHGLVFSSFTLIDGPQWTVRAQNKKHNCLLGAQCVCICYIYRAHLYLLSLLRMYKWQTKPTRLWEEDENHLLIKPVVFGNTARC